MDMLLLPASWSLRHHPSSSFLYIFLIFSIWLCSIYAKYLISYRPPHRVIHEYGYAVEEMTHFITSMHGEHCTVVLYWPVCSSYTWWICSLPPSSYTCLMSLFYIYIYLWHCYAVCVWCRLWWRSHSLLLPQNQHTRHRPWGKKTCAYPIKKAYTVSELWLTLTTRCFVFVT